VHHRSGRLIQAWWISGHTPLDCLSSEARPAGCRLSAAGLGVTVPLGSLLLLKHIMAKSAKPNRKTRGRHRASRDVVTAVRLPRVILGRVDRWRREHGTKSRSQAIQRLVEQALGTDAARRPTRKAAAKASELAGREIDRLADPSVAADEQATRKRRLIKGPREFRGVRRDPASD
jgi:hypothetical protein